MFTANNIKTAFLNRIGWRQNYDTSGIQLTEMTTSSSGLWFDGVHPVLTIDNLISIAPNFKKLHSSDQSAQNTAFTLWLKQKTEDAIVKALTAWFTEKSELGTATNLLEDKTLFTVSGDMTKLEPTSTNVVGKEFVVSRSESIISVVTKIGLQFDTNQTINLFLFKSGEVNHVQTVAVNYSGNGSVQWESVEWNMYGEGVYYIVYDSLTIVGNAINGVHDHNYHSAGLTSYPSGRFFKVTSFEVDGDTSELWDITKNKYTVSTNYGLNMKISVVCDYTKLIERQAKLFDNLVLLQVGLDLMLELAYNPNSRINRNEAGISQSKLLYEINGDTQGDNSLSIAGRYKKALNSVQFDSSGVDKICLPCRRKGAKFTSVGPG